MKFPPMPQIETKRLVLRKIEDADLQDYHDRLSRDPEVSRYLLGQTQPDPDCTAEKIRQIQAGYADGTRYHWGIAGKEDNSLFGTIALLRFAEESNSCNFAYMLGREFWGQGYATEALKAVFQFAFSEMEIDSISAEHFAANPASGAVMRKVGMEFVGITQEKYEKNGTKHDAAEYRITKEMWEHRLA